MKCLSINWKFFPIKAHYFLYFGGAASFWSFVTVFGKQLGISELGIGLIFIVAPITGLISMPLFGAIADKFNIKKPLFLFFNVLNTIAFLSFAFLPSLTPTRSRNVEFHCNEESSYLLQCPGGEVNVFHAMKNISLFIEEDLMNTQKLATENCVVQCSVTSPEKQILCSNFFGKMKGSYCDESVEDVSSIEFNILLKLSQIQIQNDCFLFPFSGKNDSLSETNNELEYSCISNLILPNSSCSINCPHNSKLNHHLEKGAGKPSINFLSYTFGIYSLLVLLAWICMAVVTSVADALCFETLGDKTNLYGKQRQWGALGWGGCTMLAGYLIDIKSQENVGLDKDYSPAFYLMGTLLLLNLLVCYKWDIKQQKKPNTLGKDVVELLCNPTIFVFILACVVVGMCTGLLWQFLFWYIEDLASSYKITTTVTNLKYIKSLQGLISVVQCFGGELPFFYLSGWFIRRLGHVHCMTLVLCAFGIRFLLYSIIENPWMVLPIELFQGLTYGIFYSNMAQYAYVVSPPGSAATVQGIVGAAFEGIGVGFGSLLGAVLYTLISGKFAFRLFGFGTLFLCLLHGVVMLLIKKQKDYKEDVPLDDVQQQAMLKQSEKQRNLESE